MGRGKIEAEEGVEVVIEVWHRHDGQIGIGRSKATPLLLTCAIKPVILAEEFQEKSS